MTDANAKLTRLQGVIEREDGSLAAVDAAEEIIKTVRSASAAGEEIDDHWVLNCVPTYAAAVADASRAERAQDRFGVPLRLYQQHYDRLRKFAKENWRGSVWLASLLNDAAWGYIEYGELRKAVRLNKEARKLLQGVTKNSVVMSGQGLSPPTPADVLSELGEALYAASGIEGMSGRSSQALDLGERAVEALAQAVELDPSRHLRAQYESVLDSFLRNAMAFGGWACRRRVRKKYGV